MTTKELIKKLADMPKNADVCFYNSDYDYTVCVGDSIDYEYDDIYSVVYLKETGKQITTAELIDKLALCDDETDVCFYYSDYNYSECISGMVEYDDDLDDVFIM